MSDLTRWAKDSNPKETIDEWEDRGSPATSDHEMWACMTGIHCHWCILACRECNYVALYLRHAKDFVQHGGLEAPQGLDAEERVLVPDERHYQ